MSRRPGNPWSPKESENLILDTCQTLLRLRRALVRDSRGAGTWGDSLDCLGALLRFQA